MWPPERRRVKRRDAVCPRVRRTTAMVPGDRKPPPGQPQAGRSSLESRGDPGHPQVPQPRQGKLHDHSTVDGDHSAARDSGAETLTITDNRTGTSYELPIAEGTIRATDLRQIKVDEDDFGLMTYDPAFMNTASCRSAITFLDGDAGILRYRGYPIEQLAEKQRFLEVAYLLVYGELPDPGAARRVGTRHHAPHVRPRERAHLHAGLPLRRPPDGDAASRASGCSARSTPRPRTSQDADNRYLQIVRLIAKMPTLGAWAYRHIDGHAVRLPGQRALLRRELPLDALHHRRPAATTPDPRIVKALDVLFILHADHEQNCSTSAVRSVGSSQVDPYSAVAAGVARPLRARSTAAPTRPCCGCSAASRRWTTSRPSSRG